MLITYTALKTPAALVFLSLLCEKVFITVAYSSLLTEVAETFGAILVIAVLANFTTLSNSVTHSFTPGLTSAAVPTVPQMASSSSVSGLHGSLVAGWVR